MPDAGDQGFTDIGGNLHAGAVNRLAAAGVVRGTSPTTFSPAESVRRDQVAAFLVRALAWVLDGELTSAGGPYFTDTAGNVHQQAIDVAFEQALVRGRVAPTDTSLGEYGPADATTRAQMASVVARLYEALFALG